MNMVTMWTFTLSKNTDNAVEIVAARPRNILYCCCNYVAGRILKLSECIYTYQWMVTLFEIWLTTLTKTLSPSLATKRGPGNFPLTLRMVLVWHNLVTFRYSILYMKKKCKVKILDESAIIGVNLILHAWVNKLLYIKCIVPCSAHYKLRKQYYNT